MGEDLISVIVPVYNVEKYIKKCIDSIINQTYKNLEIILIDDGSEDNSSKICDEYEKIDNRIKVIHKKNGGLSDARNVGIDNANGKYITFIDSDDYIEKDYVEYLYKLIKKYKTKISICSYVVVMYKNKKIDYGEKYQETLLNTEKCLERMLDEEGFTVSACAKMYLSELFKNVRYPIGKLCEDNGTTYKLIQQVDKVVYGNLSKYYYIKREGSIMTTSKFNIKKMDMIELTDEMCDYLEKKYPNILNSINRRRCYARFNVLRQAIVDKSLDKNIEDNLIKWLKSHKKEILENPKSPKRDKVALYCLLIGKIFFKFSWKIYCMIKY